MREVPFFFIANILFHKSVTQSGPIWQSLNTTFNTRSHTLRILYTICRISHTHILYTTEAPYTSSQAPMHLVHTFQTLPSTLSYFMHNLSHFRHFPYLTHFLHYFMHFVHYLSHFRSLPYTSRISHITSCISYTTFHIFRHTPLTYIPYTTTHSHYFLIGVL